MLPGRHCATGVDRGTSSIYTGRTMRVALPCFAHLRKFGWTKNGVVLQILDTVSLFISVEIFSVHNATEALQIK